MNIQVKISESLVKRQSSKISKEKNEKKIKIVIKSVQATYNIEIEEIRKKLLFDNKRGELGEAIL